MQSTWFNLTAVVAQQLQALASTRGVAWFDNPPMPLDLQDGTARGLFVLTRGDKLLDQPGLREERRVLRVVVGAFAFSTAGRAEADALHFAARDRLKSLSFRRELNQAGPARELREVEIEPELSAPAAEGAVLMSAYEIEYEQTYPSFGL